VRAKRITDAWAEQKIVREIMVFLHEHGVGTARAVRIYKTYGADAVQVMTENPYRLARDIRGIGFKTADAIAMKLGIEKTAMIRVRAGISFALTEAMDEGHCGLPTEELVPLREIARSAAGFDPHSPRSGTVRWRGHCRSRRGHPVRVSGGSVPGRACDR
jgi:exodeoxyribonuclease V alpha subunit